MNLKFTLLFIVSFQFLLLEPCHSRPIFSYIFGQTAPAKEIDETELTNSIIESYDAVQEAAPSLIDIKTNEVAPVSTIKTSYELPSARITNPLEPTPSTQPKLGNAGYPWALNTLALAARAVSSGIQAPKKFLQGTTYLGTQAVGGLRNLGNGLIDGMQDRINQGFESATDRMSQWEKRMDTYRRGLSGMTAKNPERAHSITITTNSGAPLQSFNDFISNYLPAGAGDAPLPEITSVDLSKLW